MNLVLFTSIIRKRHPQAAFKQTPSYEASHKIKNIIKSFSSSSTELKMIFSFFLIKLNKLIIVGKYAYIFKHADKMGKRTLKVP